MDVNNATILHYDASADIELLKTGVEKMWVLVSCFLVFSMQVGFAFLEAGGVRSVNVVTIVFKNLGDCAIGALMWWLVGYSISRKGDKFLDGFHMVNIDDLSAFLLNFMYLATATTIVSGAVAERINLGAYYTLTILISSIIYPMIVYWVWEGGFLREFGVVDVAGSMVVHMSSGVFSFVAAWMLGKRKLPGGADPFSEQGKQIASPHNKFLQAAGSLLLWFGWFSFNTGSISIIKHPKAVETAAVATVLAGSAGSVVGMIATSVIYSHLDLAQTCNCLLAALVSITASCAFVRPTMSVFIGATGACIYLAAHQLRVKLRVDDVIDASAVHGASGLFGVLCVCLADEDMLREYLGMPGFRLDRGKQFGIQLLSAVLIMSWSAAWSLVTCYILNKLRLFRVSQESEIQGCDGALLKCWGYDYLGDVIAEAAHNPVEGIQLLSLQYSADNTSCLGKPNQFSFVNMKDLEKCLVKEKVKEKPVKKDRHVITIPDDEGGPSEHEDEQPQAVMEEEQEEVLDKIDEMSDDEEVDPAFLRQRMSIDRHCNTDLAHTPSSSEGINTAPAIFTHCGYGDMPYPPPPMYPSDVLVQTGLHTAVLDPELEPDATTCGELSEIQQVVEPVLTPAEQQVNALPVCMQCGANNWKQKRSRPKYFIIQCSCGSESTLRKDADMFRDRCRVKGCPGCENMHLNLVYTKRYPE
eukprot:TRINITY_DN8754_c0_g3_i6.p1 TRINITY_DN8754_c0_g3~~TRINITY_DN8754_c0_g3_i6.p1  ORF type:complete len:697 (+),score=116.14 TRINITY_DN8754_c0_g3_i6:169-2259(+)